MVNRSIKSTVAHYVKKFDTRDPFELADRLKVEYIIGPMGNYSGCYTPKRKLLFYQKQNIFIYGQNRKGSQHLCSGASDPRFFDSGKSRIYKKPDCKAGGI